MIMTWPTPHLTAEDLDAFHSASLSPIASRHLDECADCRLLVERDRALLDRLETLPSFAPRGDLADRVLAQIGRPAVLPARTTRPRALALAATVAIGAGISVIWSLFNRPLLGSWIDRGSDALRNLFWESIATVAQNLSEQPWMPDLWQTGWSEGRIAAAGAALLLGYAGAMLVLRRLLIRPLAVPNANG